MIHNCWYAAIRIYFFNKPCFFLFVFEKIDGVDGVLETEFFEEDVGFLAVGRAGRVEVYFCARGGHFGRVELGRRKIW